MANPEVTVVVENLDDISEVTSVMENSEGKSEVASIVENSEEEAESNADSDSEAPLAVNLGSLESNYGFERPSTIASKYDFEWPSTIASTIAGILDLILSAIVGIFSLVWSIVLAMSANWKKIFVISCLFAVLLDPLFLYIPMVNQDMKCLTLDKNLKKAAVSLRVVTDFFYIMDIIIQSRIAENYSSLISEFRDHRGFSRLEFLRKFLLLTIAKTTIRSYILIDILAILPIPQVVILIFFLKLKASRSLNTRKVIMNSTILLQYVPRVLRIYLSCKEFRDIPNYEETAIWVKGVLNFFIYILASHVLGAVWYFFAIQRMTVCWQNACGNENGCDTFTFGCYDLHTIRNITLINDSCRIDSLNPTPFNFGIYLSVLQSGIPESTNYLQKFSSCFSWGLRNLSSLGSNLQPSIDGWENIFAAIISIIGLLLFLYLIGNLQTYMQLDTARREEHRHRMKIKRKMEEKGPEIERWLSKNGIPKRSNKDIKLQIMERVQQQLEENRDVNIDENFLFILPMQLQNYMRSCMPSTRLQKVPQLQSMDGQVLEAISEKLLPMSYTENNLIIREKRPLEVMLLVIDGLVKIESGVASRLLKAGDFYGEVLLDWVLHKDFPTALPLSTDTARATGDVEVLVLKANDLNAVVLEFGWHFRDFIYPPEDSDNRLVRLGPPLMHVT